MPLECIKIVELGTHIAVPNTTRLLAEWGAEVIKVESLYGEEWRHMGIMFKTPSSDDDNPIFFSGNAYKKFVSLDLKTTDGINIIKKLIEEADVFVTNLRLKALIKMGLDYETLKKTNESIIYYLFNGYGLRGADSDRPGFDSAAFWARTGPLVDWVEKDRTPIRVAGGLGDAASSTISAAGILAALVARNTSGKGTFLTSSLFSCGIWYSNIEIASSQKNSNQEREFQLIEDESPSPFVNYYKCKDNKLLFISEYYCEKASTAFFDIFNEKNISIDFLNRKFFQKNSIEWQKILNEKDICCEVIKHFEDVHHDIQAWENGYFEKVKLKNGKEIAMVKSPVYFSNYQTRPISISKPIGSDTKEILQTLGYLEGEIETLVNRKAVKI